MADNTQLSAGSGGDRMATAEFTFSGDSAKAQIISWGFLTGSEGAWSFSLTAAGAGAVTAGTQRVTLGSDDPGVVALEAIQASQAAIEAALAGSLTVAGTVTANLSATDNAVLDAIAASLAGTLTVGTHAVTQSGAWTVDLGATDNAVLDAIAASLAGTLTVSATNLDIRDLSQASDNVRVYANTVKDGSGTAYIPLVDADGHLQIDVLSGGGGGTQYTEGDTDASITGTALLWEDAADTLRAVSAAKPLPVGDGGGSLTVDGTVAATQSGTWTTQGFQAHDGIVGGAPVLIGAYASSTAQADVSANGDVSRLWCLLNGSLVVNLAVGNTLVTGSAGLPVAQQGTWTVDLGATDNAVLDAIAASLAGTLTVGTHAVTQSGTWTARLQDGSGNAIGSSGGALSVQVANIPNTIPIGAAAHDAAVSGNPLRIAGYASSTAPTAVSTNGDTVNFWADLNGRLHVVAGDNLITVSCTQIVRPADTTAYAALDAVSNSTSAPTARTFATVVLKDAGTGTITQARLTTSQSTCTARFRLHLFHTSAPTAINDNSPHTLLATNNATRIGEITFPACRTEGSGSDVAEAIWKDQYQDFKTVGNDDIFGLLETLDAFTPASGQTFDIELTVRPH